MYNVGVEQREQQPNEQNKHASASGNMVARSGIYERPLKNLLLGLAGYHQAPS